MDRFEVQKIDSDTDGVNYRVTDIRTDSRIATCYLEDNANLVCDALNAYYEAKSSNLKK